MSTGFDLQSLRELRDKPHLCSSRAVFTEAELRYCGTRKDPVLSIAGLISAKEAFIKAACLFEDVPEFRFTDVSVDHDVSGRPRLVLTTRLADWLSRRQLGVDVSITHSGDLAGAVVVLVQRCSP
jgi:phosphopantetheine--protein transferase-like protein